VKPYYEHAGITIYHGDCREVLPTLPKVDLVLTDPPFSEKTHAGARSGDIRHQTKPIDFPSAEVEFIRKVFELCAPSRWLITFLDWHHALPLELDPPKGLEFIRLGVWLKENPMPQMTGDRPATGWESLALLHGSSSKHWNGGGSAAVWLCGTSRYGYFGPSFHPTAKPLTIG